MNPTPVTRPGRPAGTRRRPPRVCYIAGPGDVIGTFRAWREGVEDPTQLAKTYSSEFFDTCRRLGCRALVIASHPRAGRATDGRITVEHRPSRLATARGLGYHLRSAWYLLGLIGSAVRFRSDAVVVSGVPHWYPLSLLPLLGIRVIPALHCTLWPQRTRLSSAQAVLRRLDGLLFRRRRSPVLCVSPQVLRQVTEYYGPGHPADAVFVPVYPAVAAWDADPPDAGPFRVVYAGRVEADKGVFDLVEVARRLVAAGRDVTFDIYGSGGAAAELGRRAAEVGLGNRFRLHGNLPGAELARAYRAGHAVIAPTTVAFAEGLNKVVIEGVLAGRPVVTSDVCPAAEYLGEASVVVPAGDVDGYARAIAALADDPGEYRRRREATRAAAAAFSDPDRGWGACLGRALAAVGLVRTSPGGRPPPAVGAVQ